LDKEIRTEGETIMPYGSKHRATKNLKEIIAKIDFPALVAETHFIVLGKALCPFHNDSRPSCHIYNDHFFCFACGATGDALFWLEHVHKLSKVDAIKELERREGVLSLDVPRQPKASKQPRVVVKVCDQKPLPQNIVELHYKRASTLEHIPLSLEGRGFILEDSQRFWIASENEDALIPIFNPDGSIVAIKRRRYTIKPEAMRYVYLTPNCGAPAWCSPNFSSYETVLIIEGELNAAICAAVYPDIAYMGVAGTENHLWLAAPKGKTVYVYGDGDEAGQKARDRWALTAYNIGAKEVMTVEPWEMDACDIAGKLGRDALRERLL
jgi:DNA primase